MIRKFNYTGRKKIDRQNISVSIVRGTGGVHEFNAQFQLDELKLPGDAEVCLEVYRNAAWRRFPFGTVRQIVVPDDRKLSGFDDPDVLFRIKVIDRTDRLGRILAEAREISPSRPEDTAKNRISLLWVEGTDLGNSLWRLRCDGDRPTLEVNERVNMIKEIVRSDSEFQSLVFPELIRQILYYALFEEQIEDPQEEEDIWHYWLRFACQLRDVPPLPGASASDPDKEKWIDAAVEAFSRKSQFLNLYVKKHELPEVA